MRKNILVLFLLASFIALSLVSAEIVCVNDGECNDNDARTQDRCINANTTASYCNYTSIECLSDSDCGSDGFTGENYCMFDDVFKDYHAFKCINPGSDASRCQNNLTHYKVQECDLGNPLMIYSCVDDSINPAYCKSEFRDPTFTCYTNSDCGSDGFIGSNFCTGLNVTRNYELFTCNNAGTALSSCSNSTSTRVNQTCSDECSNGACVGFTCSSDLDCNDQNPRTFDSCLNPGTVNSSCTHTNITCFTNLDCGSDIFVGDKYCKGNDVARDFDQFVCNLPGTVLSSCTNTLGIRVLEECEDCENGKCVDEEDDDNDEGTSEYSEGDYEDPDYLASLGIGRTNMTVTPEYQTPITLGQNEEEFDWSWILWLLIILVALLLIIIILVAILRR